LESPVRVRVEFRPAAWHFSVISWVSKRSEKDRNKAAARPVSRAFLLFEKCSVQIFTDSRYVRDAFEKGWIKKWQSNGWKTKWNEDVLNKDLWTRLCELRHLHHCVFHWIKGHSSTRENIRCDKLAVAAGKRARLAVDHGYENGKRLPINGKATAHQW
jgi:hypothetical protein